MVATRKDVRRRIKLVAIEATDIVFSVNLILYIPLHPSKITQSLKHSIGSHVPSQSVTGGCCKLMHNWNIYHLYPVTLCCGLFQILAPGDGVTMTGVTRMDGREADIPKCVDCQPR